MKWKNVILEVIKIILAALAGFGGGAATSL